MTSPTTATARSITEALVERNAWQEVTAAVAPLLAKAQKGDRSGLLDAVRFLLAAVGTGEAPPPKARKQAAAVALQLIQCESAWRSREEKHLEDALGLKRPARSTNPLDWKVFEFVTQEMTLRGGKVPAVFAAAGEQFDIPENTARDCYYRQRKKFKP